MALTIGRLIPILLAVILLAAVAYRAIVPDDDPYRCRAALETGQWIDHPDANGDRLPFKQWQPDGCLFHKYTSADIRQCMEGRAIVFSGDSTTREVVYGLGRLLDRDEANQNLAAREVSDRDRGVKATYHYHGIPLMYSMNPYLETTSDPKWDPVTEQLKLFREDKENHVSIVDQKGPALIMLGAGAWFAKKDDETTIWTDKYAANLFNVSEILGNRTDFITAPMDPIDGIGNQVFFAPPSPPAYTGNNEEKIKFKAFNRVRMNELQAWLRQTADDLNVSLAWAIPRLALGQNKTFIDPTGTGYHAIEIVAETKANIYLNLRCNAKLDRLNGYPYNRTCCTDYGHGSQVQLTLVALGLLYLVACVVGETFDLIADRSTPRWQLLNMETGSFVMALLMCYYADRTQMMAKGDKLWSLTDFKILCVPWVCIALATLRRSRQSHPKLEAFDSVAGQPLLSREQTDEWKGWMQCVVMVYQWTASERSPALYILVRLLVAAYLFQIGYGHTTFFLTKKDYSFRRVAAVLLRLNLLTCSLTYFMNTEYMFYYFSPLASFWFIVVYITMAVGHRSLNADIQWIFVKICIAVVVVAILIGSPLTRWAFALLRALFKIEWSLKEWEYRVSLDVVIVFIGMLVAVANHTIKDTLTLNLALRYSQSLARCSLEAYVLQFHILLAADSKGVLIIDAFKGDGSLMDRWRSLNFIVPVFICLSSMTAKATDNLIEIILNTEPSPVTTSSIPLSDTLEKDDNDTSDVDGDNGLLFLNNPDSAPLHRSRTSMARYMNDVPSAGALFSSLPGRIFMILLVMWLLNLLSPSLAKPVIPDGHTVNNLPVSMAHA
ncbi:hypothetical protein G7Z17_g12414 [Cylindrodendrum hubeiense]|uniref:Cas1p 10 TM acyl transferase domain-containing protein n=1 Tax=Cylindrodendrum hubeiense TaxID=595255 RepID=A0A9P5H0Y4_9HYPO|nr:hypothetical protein G7Z17_g12414 [Cylindrodendrum hubeiense]